MYIKDHDLQGDKSSLLTINAGVKAKAWSRKSELHSEGGLNKKGKQAKPPRKKEEYNV